MKESTLRQSTLVISVQGQSRKPEPMTVHGLEVKGFFVHRPSRPEQADRWTVSHCKSGLNVGADFRHRKHAVAFAEELGTLYDGTVDEPALIAQFSARGGKASVIELAKKHKSMPFCC